MAKAGKIFTILAISAIGLIAISASAQNANDDASRKAAPKKTNFVEGGAIQHTDDWRERSSNGYTAGGTWVSGDPEQRKTESGGNAQERVQYQEFHIGKNTERNAHSTLPPGSNEWETQKPIIGDILQGTDIRSNGIGVDQKLGQPDYRTVKARPKANSKSHRRN